LSVGRLFLVELLLKLSHQLVVRVKLHLETVSVGHKTIRLAICLAGLHFSLSVFFLHFFPCCILFSLSTFSMKDHLLNISGWTLSKKLEWEKYTYIILSFLRSNLLRLSKLIFFSFHFNLSLYIFTRHILINRRQ
jgi:hypothetical protein